MKKTNQGSEETAGRARSASTPGVRGYLAAPIIERQRPLTDALLREKEFAPASFTLSSLPGVPPQPARTPRATDIARTRVPSVDVRIDNNPANQALACADAESDSDVLYDAIEVLEAGFENSAAAREAGFIDVRYLRGDRWVPANLRALSMRGGFLVTGAPPRVGESTYVALGFQNQGVMVKGTVHHIKLSASAGGTIGFAVKFEFESARAREALASLLHQAQQAGVTVRVPPDRTGVRYPVAWPIQMASRTGKMAGVVHDMSQSGMFVSPNGDITDRELTFKLMSDIETQCLFGRLQIVRRMEEQQAKVRGLPAGFGVAISDLSDKDSAAYAGMLRRVTARAKRQVVLGAAGARAALVSQALVAAGYGVSVAQGTASLVRRLDETAVKPDAVLLDGSMVVDGLPSQWLDAMVSSRDVAVIQLNAHGPQVARLLVDELLGVV